eukprot:707031-Amphidinium_carterae.1
MDREEFANMFSNSASTQRPKAAPPAPKPPPPSKSPPQGDTYTSPKPKGPPPSMPPKGEAASSSTSGAQFGVPPAPKAPPPMHMRGTEVTTTRPLAETIGVTWSGYYGDLL